MDYPRAASDVWPGVPFPVDAAFTQNGLTYFFRDRNFWRFNDTLHATEPPHAQPFSELWRHCPPDLTYNNAKQRLSASILSLMAFSSFLLLVVQ